MLTHVIVLNAFLSRVQWLITSTISIWRFGQMSVAEGNAYLSITSKNPILWLLRSETLLHCSGQHIPLIEGILTASWWRSMRRIKKQGPPNDDPVTPSTTWLMSWHKYGDFFRILQGFLTKSYKTASEFDTLNQKKLKIFDECHFRI